MQAGEVNCRQRTGQSKRQMNCEMHCVAVSSMLFVVIYFNLEKGLVISLKVGGWKSGSTGPFYLDSIFFPQGFTMSSV